MRELPPSYDVAVVGDGAAGLATAIFIRRVNPARENPCQRRLALQRHEYRQEI
jgi:thioredoxin reductase